ncbi:hypothetical protein BJ878DRAFT_426466 [Calycina marina]|uniref:polynucleotide adenylyltransferase n=1 Tax=Calycina marina TaxID=1763456 RepID=A0A9P7YYV0_9HELO|nr:hypothetical protein BJ878DRAFT_426466 [Calycina marina]
MSRHPPPPVNGDMYRPGGYSPRGQRDNDHYQPPNDYRDRGRYDSFDRYDNYAPPQPPPGRDRDYSYNRGPPPPMYQFRNGNSRMRSPPRGPAQRSPPRRFSPPRYNGYGDRRDSYSGPDRYSQNDNMNFHFRHDPPPSFANQPPPLNYNYGPQQNDGSRVQRNVAPRGGFRGRGGRGGPRLASNRAFLKTNREPTPELMDGMMDGDQKRAKYIAPDDVSDSSEAEMDMSDAGDDTEEPQQKQIKTLKRAADADDAPKWSNPDPYTALPPVEETLRKKKDVVKLIRKARVDATAAVKTEAAPAIDDFISFGNDDTEPEYEPEPAPTGVVEQSIPAIRSGPLNALSKPARTPNPVVDLVSSDDENAVVVPNPELGNRKRTIRDEIKDTPILQEALLGNGSTRAAPRLHSSPKGKKLPVHGAILREWKGLETPWIGIDHSDTAKIGVWLHKEIYDFYEYVHPRRFEDFIRGKLVEDLRTRVQNVYHQFQPDVLTFGSYPAGLYLPTADMDVVVVSRSFMQGGPKEIGHSQGSVRKFARFLDNEGVVMPGSMDMILHAKVPLVKYVDRLTGLKVDISFENDTGLIANKTFQDWKSKHPAMPLLVTLMKHFLAMRGLNEPVNGGIGGFSVICLVTSLLQLLPQTSAGYMVPEHHLGDILMEFLDLYGNKFNWKTTAIVLNPPQYVSKSDRNMPYQHKPGAEKICIMDPNRPDNDISGGSSNTQVIIRAFRDAYHTLSQHMSKLNAGDNRQNRSILSCLWAGNYSSFALQRKHLRHLCQTLYPEYDGGD